MKVRCGCDKLVPISELKLHPKNRNVHPPEQIKRLAEILEYQGWRYPVKVSKLSGFVTSGHGRIAAATLNGWKEVPVNYQEYESKEQEYADLTADNAIALWAEIDMQGISADLKELENLNVDLLGLENFSIDETVEGKCDEDEIPESAPPIVQMGDLFTLGNHRLLCGDSTKADQVARLMNGEKADMVFTDPPYIGMVGAEWDKKPLDWEAVFLGISEAASPNANIVITGQTPIIFKWIPIIEKHFTYVQDLVWLKQRAINIAQVNFARRHENVLWFRRGEKYFNADAARTEMEVRRQNKTTRQRKLKGRDVNFAGMDEWVDGFSAQSVLEFGRVYHHHKEYEGHPTQKPTELVGYLLEALSTTSCNVWDSFLGSGSTLIACEKTNRKCYGMEINPHYCDVIIARWEKFTGKKAVKHG